MPNLYWILLLTLLLCVLTQETVAQTHATAQTHKTVDSTVEHLDLSVPHHPAPDRFVSFALPLPEGSSSVLTSANRDRLVSRVEAPWHHRFETGSTFRTTWTPYGDTQSVFRWNQVTFRGGTTFTTGRPLANQWAGMTAVEEALVGFPDADAVRFALPESIRPAPRAVRVGVEFEF